MSGQTVVFPYPRWTLMYDSPDSLALAGGFSTGSPVGASPQPANPLDVFAAMMQRRRVSLDEALLWGTTEAMDSVAEIAYVNAQGKSRSQFKCLKSVREAMNEAGLSAASTFGENPEKAVAYFRRTPGYLEVEGVSGDAIPLLPRGTIVLYASGTDPRLSHAQIMLGYDYAASDYLHDSRVYTGNTISRAWAFIPYGE